MACCYRKEVMFSISGKSIIVLYFLIISARGLMMHVRKVCHESENNLVTSYLTSDTTGLNVGGLQDLTFFTSSVVPTECELIFGAQVLLIQLKRRILILVILFVAVSLHFLPREIDSHILFAPDENRLQRMLDCVARWSSQCRLWKY